MIDMDARHSVRQVMLRSTLFAALGMASLASVVPRPLAAQNEHKVREFLPQPVAYPQEEFLVLG